MSGTNQTQRIEYDVIVVGGGAAGMMAACTAAEQGCRVLLLEKNDKMGKKLAITGKGRCNVTNDCDFETLLANVPTNPKFLFAAFREFTTADTKAFFESRGVPLKTERGNRVFPVSDKASDIVSALVSACKDSGVVTRRAEVRSITKDGEIFVVSCGEKTYSSSKVIICTGGVSYRACGSTGDGYEFAKSFGHTIIEPKASLVPLTSGDLICEECMGLSLKNVNVTLRDGKKIVYSEQGEMLFTHFGVSGPVILSASAHIRKFPITMSIDLKPALDEKTLDARLLRDFEKNKNKEFKNSLGELLPKKLIDIVVFRSEIDGDKRVNEITKEERRRLLMLLKDLSFTITGTRPVNEAIITSGGVKCSEINPSTMESKLCSGLYFAGEVIDVDAYTGGFNLQIAFSTAVKAAKSAAW